MKIVFIIPPNIHYIEPYAFVKADKSNTVRPYLGLLYVAAALRKSLGIEARIVDSNADGLTLEAIGEIIRRETPDLVGFSVLTFNLLNCMEVSRLIRKYSPSTKICYGGWHPTLYPRETLEIGCADFIVIGEGETSFTELVKVLQKRQCPDEDDLGNIRGIGFRTEKGEVRITPPSEALRNLDELPFPAYDLMDTSKYSNLLAITGQSVVIMTSRGCPQRCAFCDMRKTAYRFRRPANIMEEIVYWTQRGVKEFFIQDDNFTINRTRTIEFCKLLIEADLGIAYKISSRVDYLDDEIMGYLKRSGCYRIYFGVESGSQRVLNYLEKGITVDQTRDVFRIARKYGIDRCAYIMIGCPSEEKTDIEMTMRLVKDIRPEHLHCSICAPMPKTYLYQKLLNEGLITHDYWLEFARNPDPSFRTPFINQFFSSEELRNMQDSIQRQFYMDPRIILREIRKTRDIKQFLAKAMMAFRVIFR